MKKIILASGSPRRKQLLEMMGLEFEVSPSTYEEDMSHSSDPYELAKFLSLKKAQDVALKHKQDNAIIIAADTLISCDDKIFGKPHTPERAKEMLNAMSGRAHYVITGYTLIDTETNQIISDTKKTKVYFRELTQREIDAYIATGEPLDRAGAYAIQEKGSFLVEKVEGDYSNFMGLPVNDVMLALRKLGVKVMGE